MLARLAVVAVVATTAFSPAHAATANVTSDATDAYRELCGVDLAGGDIGNHYAPTAGLCAALCTLRADCDAATWTNYDEGTCWFKTYSQGGVKPVANAGAASFLRRPDNTNGFASIVRLDGVDFPGADLRNEPAKDEWACFGSCYLTYDNCYAATWTDYNGGWCWMKTKGTDGVANPGAVSAIFTRKFNGLECPV